MGFQGASAVYFMSLIPETPHHGILVDDDIFVDDRILKCRWLLSESNASIWDSFSAEIGPRLRQGDCLKPIGFKFCLPFLLFLNSFLSLESYS